MTDAILGWDNAAGEGDLCLAGADLAADDGLRTAVLVSLFTDRRADVEELPEGDTDRRGWWGDGLSEDDPIGSRLWLLGRRALTADLLPDAEAAASDALAWMVEDGVAASVEVDAALQGREALDLAVRIVLPDDSTREFTFQDALRAA